MQSELKAIKQRLHNCFFLKKKKKSIMRWCKETEGRERKNDHRIKGVNGQKEKEQRTRSRKTKVNVLILDASED